MIIRANGISSHSASAPEVHSPPSDTGLSIPDSRLVMARAVPLAKMGLLGKANDIMQLYDAVPPIGDGLLHLLATRQGHRVFASEELQTVVSGDVSER